MDIRIPSDLPATQPAVSTVGDLLAQLKAAGTIEAEVLERLPANKLLLSSRLGEILTSNSLNYGVGDRLSLRFDDSARQPVLRASSRPPAPIVLDSRQHPELSRALTPGRPSLATVVGLVAQRAEIRLADEILQLPRQVTAVRNQLLSLRRNDLRHSIEVTRIDRKAIYKAILKQLVPQQTESAASSLVRLLELVAANAIKPQSAPARPSATGRPPGATLATAAPAGGDKRAGVGITGPGSGPARGRIAGGGPQAVATAVSTSPGKTSETRAPDGGEQPLTRPPAPIRATIPPPGARLAATGRDLFDPASHPHGITTYRKTGETTNGGTATTQRLLEPGQPGLKRMQVGAAALNSRAAGVAGTGTPASRWRAGAGRVPGQGAAPAAAGAQLVGAPIAPRPDRTTSPPRQDAAPVSSPIPRLQPLLQLVTRFPDIDAAQIKKWLEFARLIYPSGTTVSTPARPDIFTLMQLSGETENVSREPARAGQHGAGKFTQSDSTAPGTQAQEPRLLQHRESLRLIEQSLSHNLLQRATLGLQQETQQPFSFGFAMPYVDEGQPRSLFIDLTERNQAREEAERGWDIRLNFDLAGLGPIACHLVLAGRSIAASFYSEQAQTRERIEAELPLLRQQLLRAGFTPGEFHSFPGKPAPQRTSTAVDFPEALIDIEV